MFKRTLVVFGLLMFFICLCIIRLDDISSGSDLYDAALCQQSYKIKVCDIRGNIYDCRNYPLVNQYNKFATVVVPSVQSINDVYKFISEDNVSKVCEQFKFGRPFVVEVSKRDNVPNIDMFKIPVRYSSVTLAPHVIGYIDGDKNGVYGIEKAYNEFLKDKDNAVYVKYNVDAANKIITGNNKFIDDKSYMMSKGVVLNIDARIQKLAEEVSNKYIEKGAVLITEVPNCEIRASVSLPSFSPRNVSDYLNDKNSPLLNRVMCKYNVGSIFKLITAATALESGVSEDYSYECSGGIDIQDKVFHCFNGKPHGTVDMEKAIAYSCNTYFIELLKSIDITDMLKLSSELNFGKSQELAPGIISSSGYLPSDEELKSEKNRANFSFGQGSLLATPLQISGLINMIASKGEYSEPKLVKGLVNENLKFINSCDKAKKKRVLSEQTAEKLKKYMKASIDYGTSLKGRPENMEACAKTSTAETGIKDGDRSIIQAWYAGFFPLDKPKYCIVILSEDAVRGGGDSCGPVFKEIVDKMQSDLKELFLD